MHRSSVDRESGPDQSPAAPASASLRSPGSQGRKALAVAVWYQTALTDLEPSRPEGLALFQMLNEKPELCPRGKGEPAASARSPLVKRHRGREGGTGPVLEQRWGNNS